MSNSNSVDAKKMSWGKKLLFTLVAAAVLVVILFFVLTSGAFIKGVVLPKAGQSMHAEIRATDVSLSLFSQILLRDLTVRTTGTEPLFSVSEVKVRYGLMDILKGHIRVDEISLISPRVQIVKETNGTSNLDPLLQGQAKKEGASKALQLAVRNVTLKNGSVTLLEKLPVGFKTTDLSDLNLSVDRVENGQNGKIILGAGIRLENLSATNRGLLQGKASAALDFGLDASLLPQLLKGSVDLDVAKGEGAYHGLAALTGKLEADVTPAEIRQLTLRLSQNGKDMARIDAKGPLNLTAMEGRLNVDIASIDRQLLNLAGASHGWDFQQSVLNSSNVVVLSQKGGLIAVSGKLGGQKLSISQAAQTTPILDLDLTYETSLNLAAKNASVQALSLAGRQSGTEFLRADLDRPMGLSWGTAQQNLPDAALRVAVTNFNLAQWQAVLGTNSPQGRLSAAGRLGSTRGGVLLDWTLAAEITDLSARLGTNRIDQARLKLEAAGTVEQMETAAIKPMRLELIQRDLPLVLVEGGLKYDLAKKDGTVQITVTGPLPGLVRQAGLAGVELSSGTLKFVVEATLASGATQAKGTLGLEHLTGKYGNYPLQDFSVTAAGDLSLKGGTVVDFRQLVVKLDPTARAKNELRINGHIDLAPTNAAPGVLQIEAESLDVTSYYNFAANAKQSNPPGSAPSANPGQPSGEPPAVNLPFQDLTVHLKVGQFFLRDVSISNWNAKLAVNKGAVTIKPFQMALNGGAVDAAIALNLAVPGYTYDLSFRADKVPVDPLRSSFTTNSPGSLTGDLTASVQLKGAGITGPSLKKNLSGDFSFGMTNLDLQIIGPKLRAVLTPIALILRLPELLRSPLEVVDVRAAAASGVINVTQAYLASEVFHGNAKGTVMLEDVLTNSLLNLPIELSLRRSLAQKASLLPANTPTNAAFVPLPQFAKVTGTVGAPKSDIDKMVISGMVLKSAVGLVPMVGDTTGNLLQGVGNLLTGQKTTGATPPPANTTNAAPTATGNLLRGLSGFLGGNRTNSTAPTNSPAKPVNRR